MNIQEIKTLLIAVAALERESGQKYENLREKVQKLIDDYHNEEKTKKPKVGRPNISKKK